ncbi:MAG TPA: hypothetical protein VFV67_33760 [Actinophytocola sp.]|uniref:hypothetical protein n=1 Tax=Actinophytocola sp. TaxID=1872138 RepID=UPI002DBB7235|nr:hypothetical protein [Actinophytocola sp.]HEU5475636.1 hypothetical protein [Actinophytocola sp.]
MSAPAATRPVPTAGPPTPEAPDRSLRGHQALSLLAAISLFGGAWIAWQTTIQLHWTGVVGMGAMLAGMVLGVLTAAASTSRQLGRIDVVTLVTALCVLAGWTRTHLFYNVGYGTDEAAFVHQSAELLLQGVNPYGVDLSDALSRFHVPIHFATMTMDGQTVDTLSYPALSVLITAVAIPLTGGVQTVPLVTVAALGVTAVLAFLLLPVAWRPAAVVSCVGLPVMFWLAIGGLTALIALPFLTVAVAGWTRVGESGALGRSGVVRAACLGLAAATQPLVWFAVPFAISGLWLLRRGQLPARWATALTLRYLLVAAGAFAVVNLPFLVWDAGLWWGGVGETLSQHAIPYGQGLVGLSLFFGIGGGAVDWFNYAGACAGLGVFVLYLAWFRRLGMAAWILPWLAFFPSGRSLAGYFMILAPIWLVSVLTTNREEFARAARLPLPRLGWAWTRKPAVICLVVFAPCLAASAVAMSTPQPLRLEVIGVQTGGQLQSVWQLRVRATNTTPGTLHPHFATNPSGQASTRWNIIEGPVELPGGDTAEYQLVAPNIGSMPGLTTPFVVHAFTASPRTVSSSPLATPQPYRVALLPGYVNVPLRPGQAITVSAALRSPAGGPVHRAGVRVALGQVSYAQGGPLAGEARINGLDQGRSPAFATTGPDGTALFQLICTQAQARPIYFQAWIDEAGTHPFGYSEIVPVLWSEGPT